jgi:hypothetical protein
MRIHVPEQSDCLEPPLPDEEHKENGMYKKERMNQK